MERQPASTYAINGHPDADGWFSLERFDLATGEKDGARVRVRPDDGGRVEVYELHLLDSGEPITAQRLRAFNLGTIGMMIGAILLVHELEGQKPPPPRGGLEAPASRGYDDAFYERVAGAYRAALARGDKPVAAVAAEAGVPRSTAARWVKEARKRPGVSLGPATPGKAGEARA